MKYKVGDKVKVREDLQTNKDYNNCTCVEEMEEYKGVVATITKCFDTDIDDDGAYEIDLDDGEWFWTDDMFERIANNDTVDIGYHLKYCGHRVLKDVLQGDTGVKRIYYTKNYDTQYIIPIDAIEFIVPHED